MPFPYAPCMLGVFSWLCSDSTYFASPFWEGKKILNSSRKEEKVFCKKKERKKRESRFQCVKPFARFTTGSRHDRTFHICTYKTKDFPCPETKRERKGKELRSGHRGLAATE